MSNKEQDDHMQLGVSIPIDWTIPEDFPSSYASNMLAQAGEYELILSFFHTKLPLLAGTPEENRAVLEQIKSIKPTCVSQIIVSPDLVPKIIDVLQAAYDKYIAIKNLSEGSKE